MDIADIFYAPPHLMETKTERPILFSTQMVQAILEYRKTMTRRIVKPQPYKEGIWWRHPGNKPKAKKGTGSISSTIPPDEFWSYLCPYGIVGDLLWVRETWEPVPYEANGIYDTGSRTEIRIRYKATDSEYFNKWHPSIYMPKAAARIWLEITDIRVERLQDITESDAKAEGFESLYYAPAFDGDPFSGTVPASHFFKETFRELAKSNDIMLNPWVWVICFKVISTTGRPGSLNK